MYLTTAKVVQSETRSIGHFTLRPQKRDGLLGTGTGGVGGGGVEELTKE